MLVTFTENSQKIPQQTCDSGHNLEVLLVISTYILWITKLLKSTKHLESTHRCL